MFYDLAVKLKESILRDKLTSSFANYSLTVLLPLLMSPFTQLYSRLVHLWYCGLYPWSFYLLECGFCLMGNSLAASLVSRVHSDSVLVLECGPGASSLAILITSLLDFSFSLQLFILTMLFSSIPCFLLLNKCICRILAPSVIVLLTASTDLPGPSNFYWPILLRLWVCCPCHCCRWVLCSAL